MRPPVSLLIRIAFTLAMLAASGAQAQQQADPPGRVARLNYTEGNVVSAPAGDDEWTDAQPNRPLAIGDKLWTDKGVRAEVQAGSSVVRMDGRTQLTVLALDDQAVQMSVTQGTVYLRVRNLPEGENFEVDTPNLAYRAAYPGDYRIDVDPQRGVTRVTIHSGTGAVYGEKGQVLPMGGGQQITFKGRTLEKVDVQEQPPQDNFDRWAAERNRRDDQSIAARYIPREVVGYQLLDANGEWRRDDNYGPVWYPQGMPANWAPYRSGRWEWMEPWGWTWIDAAPWAFATSHYGRWTMIGARWAWVPGQLGVRPIYAPALAAFVGNGNAPLAIGGKPSVAWFPLAPGEAWQPAFRASPLYISSVNANMPPLKQGDYLYQRRPEALTAISLEDFNRGKSSKGNALKVAANMVADSQVIAPPAMPEHRRSVVARAPAPVAAPPTPQSAPIQQVTSSGPSLQQQIEAAKPAQLEAQKQAQLQAQREADVQRDRAAQLEQERAQREQAQAEAARRDQQRRTAEQQRIADKLRVAEQERHAEQQRTAEQQRQLAQRQQKIAEQQKVAQQRAEQQRAEQRADQKRIAQQQAKAAKAAEQAKLAQAQAAEQARREAAAKRAEQARREQVAKRERELQARRAQQAKRVAAAAAKKDEQARQAAHAQQVEQARRAADRDAQVLAQQRAQREAMQKQQAAAEQFKRDQQAYEEQQKAKAPQRQRPDLRKTPPAAPEPEVWQRSIPVLTPGRTS